MVPAPAGTGGLIGSSESGNRSRPKLPLLPTGVGWPGSAGCSIGCGAGARGTGLPTLTAFSLAP